MLRRWTWCRGAALALLALLLGLAGCTGKPGQPAPGPGPGEAGGAAFPGRLAYVRGGDIFILTAGQAPVQVTADGENLAPAWAPDGRWLAFLKRTDGGLAQVWVVPASGTGARVVDTAVRVPAIWTAFAWAPGGGHLAYVGLNDRSRPGDLWVVEVTEAGPGQARRLYASAAGIFGFAWAPDGRRLAVSAGSARPGSGEPVRIESVPAAGGQTTVLLNWAAVSAALRQPGTALAAELVNLTWSPDGQWLTFAGLPASASQMVDGVSLYLLHRDTATLHRLGFMLAYPQWLQWSPRGDRLAVIAGAGRDVGWGKKLVVFDPQKPQKPLLELTPPGQADKDPRWAPDGQSLVVSRMAEERPGAAEQGQPGPAGWVPKGAVTVATGGEPRPVTDGHAGADVAPRFSADGRWVLFVRIQENRPSVWIAGADGGYPTLLVQEIDVPPGFAGELHTAAVLDWTGR